MLLSPNRKRSTKYDVEEISRRIEDRSEGLTESGAVVSYRRAMQQATVWACVRIISESIASLPVELVRKGPGGTIQPVEDHPALDLLHRPNDWQTCHEFIQQNVIWMELRGNGYAFKVRSGDGRVRRLMPISEDFVDVQQLGDWALRYYIGSEHPQVSGEFGPDRVMHWRNFALDSYRGLSTIGYAREAVGLALQTETHGARLFRQGAQGGMVLEHPGTLSDDAYNRLKESVSKTWEGASNAWRTKILEEGMKVNNLGMTNEDSQFLETRKFQKEEIASLFGVPMFLLNASEKATTWGSGLEQITKSFIRFTLGPRLHRIAQIFAHELLAPNERRDLMFRFNSDAFTLGDFKERMDGYRSGIESGVMNPNEARKKEGMNPRDNGDEYRRPVNIAIEGEENEETLP